MTLIKITPENMNDFPAGTIVLLRAGAYYPEVEGVVVGAELLPATKWFPASARLIVEMSGEDGTHKMIVTQLFPDAKKVGPIGTYLVKLAEKVAPKKVSPWAAEY
jgi:hypothetical protein